MAPYPVERPFVPSGRDREKAINYSGAAMCVRYAPAKIDGLHFMRGSPDISID